MNLIENFSKIWDNGTISPESLRIDEIENFKRSTGAKKVVGAKWNYDGKEYKTSYYARLLADKTGLVHFEKDDLRSGRLVVRNGDNSRRVVIGVPVVDINSRPEDGYLNLPPSPSHFGGIEWGCEGNDGNTDYLFDFDWRTGRLIRYARPSRPW